METPPGKPRAQGSPHRAKAWTVHFCEPVGFTTDSVLSLQLPAGDYELSEQSDIHYELRASEEYSLIFRVSEVERMRASGKLVIDGMWP